MLDQSLIEAYRATEYVLFVGDGDEITLKIGEPNPAFDRALAQRGANTAIVVTAYNPRSAILPEAENRARHARLTALLEDRGFDYALGEGRDPTGHWKAELECVVFGISAEIGLDIARAFDQNAIVSVTRGGAPALLFPDLT